MCIFYTKNPDEKDQLYKDMSFIHPLYMSYYTFLNGFYLDILPLSNEKLLI